VENLRLNAERIGSARKVLEARRTGRLRRRERRRRGWRRLRGGTRVTEYLNSASRPKQPHAFAPRQAQQPRTGGLGCGGGGLGGGGGGGGDIGGGGGSITTVTFAPSDTASSLALPATRNTSVCADVTTSRIPAAAWQLASAVAVVFSGAVTTVDCSDTRHADVGATASSHAHAQMALPLHPSPSVFCVKLVASSAMFCPEPTRMAPPPASAPSPPSATMVPLCAEASPAAAVILLLRNVQLMMDAKPSVGSNEPV
jgi:hypothetical protein